MVAILRSQGVNCFNPGARQDDRAVAASPRQDAASVSTFPVRRPGVSLSQGFKFIHNLNSLKFIENYQKNTKKNDPH